MKLKLINQPSRLDHQPLSYRRHEVNELKLTLINTTYEISASCRSV